MTPHGGAEAARAHLVEALIADLVGPFARKPGETHSDAPEVLRIAPSRWYLTGFLVPETQGLVEQPDDDDDDAGAGDDDDAPENSRAEPIARRPRRLPASMGLSVFVPAHATTLTAHVGWADYQRIDVDGHRQWSRTPRRRTVTLPLDDASLRAGLPLPDAGGLTLEGNLETLPDGSRTAAVFLVNRRNPVQQVVGLDEAYAFQAHLALECPEGFLGRADDSAQHSDDFDDRVNDLQFRHHRVWAVGHGVSTRAPDGEPVTRLETTWLPTALVHSVEAHTLDDVEVRMEALAALPTPGATALALSPLVSAYRAWIDERATADVGSDARRQTRDALIAQARHAARRIEAGIATLAQDADAFDAFRWMNGAMAEAERHARPDATPRWRLFQLAFILLNLAPAEDEAHPERDVVDLIFFPTGGGKTQAYLGVIAFTLLLRRLRGQSRPDGGLGVAVLLRYTLRLLTLDQLGRAATLMCALELLRQKHPARLGDVRFSIGLWVGASATANTLEQVAKQLTHYRNDNSAHAQSPFPLAACPWCGTDFTRDCFTLKPSASRPQEVLVGCANLDCGFNLGRARDGLPVLFVDEQIYRELPAFLVATVDKFALLPWRGETGMLFGRALGRTGRAFIGPCDAPTAAARAETKLPDGLRPPELIVQDELHLISGPLGSMVGLYEAALLALAPKARLVASTATVRRSAEQVRRLYGRPVALFPPPGIDAQDTFFAKEASTGARQYIGVAPMGRPHKATQLRVYVALLTAAQKAATTLGPEAADAYLTLVGYFNSLRELGGMRRLVEDEVRRLAATRAQRRPEDFDADAAHPWAGDRAVRSEPVELTSREKTSAIKHAKNRLGLAHGEAQAVDIVLASNMISVGVDIDRLGLMVVSGQPKTTSEYIQASSRVGRRADRPGLVVTCLNPARPRDRSHFERFGAYHAAFYRWVEATSVTPFSAPALDRGLAGVVVAIARLMRVGGTHPTAVMRLGELRRQVEADLEVLTARATAASSDKAAGEAAGALVRQRARRLLDAWQRIVDDARREAGSRVYSTLDAEGKHQRALLRTVLDPTEGVSPDERRFEAPLSMRDVEGTVHLWVERQPLGGYATPKARVTEAGDGES